MKYINIPQEEDGDSSVDSVESKLRRRLGVWGGDSSREGDVVTSSKLSEVLQSWGSVEWSSVELEEEGEGGGDQVVVRHYNSAGGASGSGVEESPVGRSEGRLDEHEPVGERCEPADDSGAIALNDHAPAPHSDELSLSGNCETKEEKRQSQANAQELSLSDQVPDLPLLQTASAARPEQLWTQGRVTICLGVLSLVSLVVHSWEHDIFSDPSSELLGTAAVDGKHEDDIASVKMPIDKPLSAASTPTQPRETHSYHPQGSSESTYLNASIQGSSTVASAEETSQATSSVDIVKVQLDGVTQLELDDDDKEDCEVPGEEDDQIVQMLLERIALLEEALRQIDS
ncbi:hypothetical protein PF006_g28242 [Phytophthora fragariae]|uniref:Uncharacterized protein n=1 Tax=Phytophthora fragariae TaxID=53985 RepID=A0A6A3QGB0_9STRA|nr:hypothetical protein PF006_g28242 [Phytophthora fragariae]